MGNQWLVFLIVLTLVTASVRWLANQKRRQALQAWARQQGWNYEDRNDLLTDSFVSHPFNIGGGQRATSVMNGGYRGRDASIFQYQYTISTGKSRSTSYFRVFVIGLPCAVGFLSIKPEGLFAKLGNALGFDDVQLESENFNRAFRLTASSKKIAYDLIPPQTIELLLAHPSVALHTEGPLLVIVETGQLHVNDIGGQLEILSEFVDNVPPFVWRDHGAETPDGGTGGH